MLKNLQLTIADKALDTAGSMPSDDGLYSRSDPLASLPLPDERPPPMHAAERPPPPRDEPRSAPYHQARPGPPLQDHAFAGPPSYPPLPPPLPPHAAADMAAAAAAAEDNYRRLAATHAEVEARILADRSNALAQARAASPAKAAPPPPPPMPGAQTAGHMLYAHHVTGSFQHYPTQSCIG